MKEITMTQLKRNIDHYVQELFQPMKAENVVYSSLKLLNRFSFAELKNIEIEETLFQELYQYTISLNSYQQKIYSSTKLKITKDELIITDINGEVRREWLSDFDINLLAKDIILLRSAGYTLAQTTSRFFKESFQVNSTDIMWNSKFMQDLLTLISNFELKHGPSRKIRFRNGNLVITSLAGEYPIAFDLEELKKELLSYIQKHPNDILIKNIIFGTLEEIYQLKSIRNTKDTLYDQLATYIKENSKFQENFERYQQLKIQKKEKIQQSTKLQKERDFVDRITFLSRESPHSHFRMY